MEIYLEKELEQVKRIDDNKRYWFIRTYSGEAFQDYIDGNYVGVGLNKVPLSYIKAASKGEKEFNNLYNYIINNTRYKKGEATKIANQLIWFNNDIKKGDTIIIPTKNSTELAFGIVESDIYIKENPSKIKVRHKEEFLPEKRRKVKWEKVIDRDEMQGDLRSLLASHQGVTNADDYAVAIEGLLDSIFIKDEHIHLVIQIKQDESINAFDLSRFLNGLTFFYQEFCKANGCEEDEELTIKIKVQSRGKTILKALQYAGILGLAGLITLSNNNSLKIEIGGVKLEGKSDGLLKSFSDFKDATQRRQIEWAKFQDSITKLKADDSPIEGEPLKDSANYSKTSRKQEDSGNDSKGK